MSCTALSWNIWSRDDLGFRWTKRREAVIDFIRTLAPAVLGLQEVRARWVDDLREHLPEYLCVSQSRDRGDEGESTPVFIRKDRFILRRTETHWLSETPTVASRGWDAMHPRFALFCHLESTEMPSPFLLVNTHLDHWGKRARKQSVALLRTLVAGIPGEPPCLMMGDFNFRPTEEPYQILTEDGLFSDSLLGGSQVTWQGWGLASLGQARLDYFFSRNLKVSQCRVVPPLWGRRRLSDHDALWAEFTPGEGTSR